MLEKGTMHEQEGLVVSGRTCHSTVVCACVRERGNMTKGDSSVNAESGYESGEHVTRTTGREIGGRSNMKNELRNGVWHFGTNDFVANNDQCVCAALANGVSVLFGKEPAKNVYNSLLARKQTFTTIKQLFNIVHELPLPLTLQRVAKHERAAFINEPFKWLSFRNRGVWIVRLTQAHVVDHCVIIEASKRLIRDSASPYPLDLSEDVLHSCGETKHQDYT